MPRNARFHELFLHNVGILPYSPLLIK